MHLNKKILLLIVFLVNRTIFPQQKNIPEEMVLIKADEFTPFFSEEKESKEVKVESFLIDKYPVTNKEYLEFVKANPEWQRSKVKAIFADKSYLKNWKDDLEPGSNVYLDAPVTNISWFAARAYCEWKGKRLPTEAEWEYLAKASKTKSDGTKDEKYIQQIIDWYSKPTPDMIQRVGQNDPNFFGIYDMHGLTWEWIDDFNTVMVTGESRGDSGLERDLFCGSGSVRTINPQDYAAYMRYAFRSSLKANYTVNNLGFRCVKEVR